MSEVEDFANFFDQQTKQRAYSNNAISQDASPDDAQRAIELGQSMSQPPEKILPNLEEYERAYKLTLGNELIRNNQNLGTYLAKNPLNAHISGDDLGNLDAVTNQFNVLGLPLNMTMAKKALQGFKEGWGDQPLGWATTQLVPGYFQMNPASQLAWKSLGLPLELLTRGIGGG